MKSVLYFAAHWQLNKILLLLSSASSSLSSSEVSAGCQGKSHVSEMFELRSTVRKWEVSYTKGRKKAIGYVSW